MSATRHSAEVAASVVLTRDDAPFGWVYVRHPVTGARHLMPTYDLGLHAFDMECPCRPVDEGAWISHNAYDGRDAYELGQRRPH